MSQGIIKEIKKKQKKEGRITKSNVSCLVFWKNFLGVLQAFEGARTADSIGTFITQFYPLKGATKITNIKARNKVIKTKKNK